MKVFEKIYDGESLYDLDRDIAEAFEGEYNPEINKIPQDEYGMQLGQFKVTVEWTPSDE